MDYRDAPRWLLFSALPRLATSAASAGVRAAVENVRTARQLSRHFDTAHAEAPASDLPTGLAANLYGDVLRSQVARLAGLPVERELASLLFAHGVHEDGDSLLLPRPWRGIVGVALGAFAAFPFDLVRTRQAVNVFKGPLQVKQRRISISTVAPRLEDADELFRGVGVGVLHSVLFHLISGVFAGVAESAGVADTLRERIPVLGVSASKLVVRLGINSVTSILLTPIELAKKRIQNRTSDAGLIPTLAVMHSEGGVGEWFAGAASAPLEHILPTLTHGLLCALFYGRRTSPHTVTTTTTT